MFGKLITIGIVFCFSIFMGFQNYALALPCSQGSVSGSVDCQDGAIGSNNDFPAPDTVNTESFFGHDDWEYLSKFNVEEGLDVEIDVDWIVTPESGSWADNKGFWSFNADVWSNYADVMIVVKNGNNDPGIYFSGYLLDNTPTSMPTSGSWETGDKDLSHLTLYGRGSTPVPEPTTMLLFGTGLAGLVGSRMRKKKQ